MAATRVTPNSEPRGPHPLRVPLLQRKGPSRVGPLLPVAILPLVLWGWLVASYWPFTVDDAFITFRYAENLAAGQGPTFNPGQPPAEGCTTFLWMLLLAIPHLLRLDPVVFAKLLGVLSTLASMAVSCRLVERLATAPAGWARHAAAFAALLMLCAFPPSAIHAVSGMETAFYTLLLMAFFDAVTALTTGGDGRTRWLCGALGLLVGLTRPEGNLAVVVAWSTLLARGAAIPRRSLLRVLVLAYVLPGTAYVLWRWTYYGLPFPLAYYVKVASPAAADGKDQVLSFVGHFMIPGGLFALWGLATAPARVLPAALATGALLLFFLFPDHVMGFDWRYLFPVAPLLVVLVASGFGALQNRIISIEVGTRSGITLSRSLLVGLYLGSLAWICAGSLRGVGINIASKRFYAKGMRDAHIALGKQMGSLETGASVPLLAVADAGAIPYYSKWRTIDLFGLNEPTIARSARHDPEFVLSQKPDLIILNSKSSVEFLPRMPWVEDLYAGSLRHGLVTLRTLRVQEGGYYLWLLADPVNPLVQPLLQRSPQQEEASKVVVLEARCQSCQAIWRVQANLDEEHPLRGGRLPFPADDRLDCPQCGAPVDLSQARREIETRTKKHIVPSTGGR